LVNTLIEQTVMVNSLNRTHNSSVWIIEGSDNQDSDNQGSTVALFKDYLNIEPMTLVCCIAY